MEPPEKISQRPGAEKPKPWLTWVAPVVLAVLLLLPAGTPLEGPGGSTLQADGFVGGDAPEPIFGDAPPPGAPIVPTNGSEREVLALGPDARSPEEGALQAGSDPIPVLLVPGWNDVAVDLEALRDRFLASGWPEDRVAAMGFQDPIGSNEANAREVAEAVELLRRTTGAPRVDVVAHSMGGLAVRQYLRFEGGAERVRRVVFLGTPHRGTVLAALAWGDGAREMVPGSDFLERLNERAGRPDGVDKLALRTTLDLRVVPASSAVLPGAQNVEICCPTHPGMVDDDATFVEIERFLVDGIAGPGPVVPWSPGG